MYSMQVEDAIVSAAVEECLVTPHTSAVGVLLQVRVSLHRSFLSQLCAQIASQSLHCLASHSSLEDFSRVYFLS